MKTNTKFGSLAVASVAALLILTACGSKSTPSTGGGGSSATSNGSATVSTKTVAGIGSVLVDQSGMTLYYDKNESGGTIACTGACATAWPPLLVPTGATAATAGTGIDASKLGTIARPDGSMQVTFNGMPLYGFTGDTSAGQATGQGVSGFYAATVSGTGSSSGSGSGGYGSGGYG